MKFACRCGATIRDQSSNLPYKADVLPDQHWDQFFGTAAAAIAELVDSEQDNDAWARRHLGPEYPTRLKTDEIIGDFLSALQHGAMRPAYECTQCGRLWIERAGGDLVSFTPEDGTYHAVLAGN